MPFEILKLYFLSKNSLKRDDTRNIIQAYLSQIKKKYQSHSKNDP
jgi:hypothetical protein